MKTLRKILIVDDDPVVGKSFDRVLSGRGYVVFTAIDGAEALRKIAAEKAAEDSAAAVAAGKPAQSPEIIARRVEGSAQKFLKEVSLLNQSFVKNDKQTVEQMLKEKATKVAGFTLYVVGEGIEKKVDDFAAEVAAQVAAAQGG